MGEDRVSKEKNNAKTCFVLFSGRKSKTSSIKQKERQESAAGFLEADRTGQMWGHDYTEHSGIIKMSHEIWQ